MRFMWVGIGGAVGSVLRYLVGLWLGDARFPWGTLSVNIVGSFALGLLFALAPGRWPVAATTGISVGLIGGFTTFSTFAWETLATAQGGDHGRAGLYLLVSVVGGLVAALIGHLAGRGLA
jgi:CrcB protein